MSDVIDGEEKDVRPSDVGAREALIRSTIRLIATSGMRGATHRAIAADAGLTHGMIVHYFGSRDALIAASMEYAVQRLLRDARTPMPGEIDEIGSHINEIIETDMEALAFQQEMRNEARRRPDIAHLGEQMTVHFEDGVRRQLNGLGITDEGVVLMTAATLTGLVARRLAIDDTAAVEHALTALRRCLTSELARAR